MFVFFPSWSFLSDQIWVPVFFIHADEPTGCSGDFHWRIWRIWQVRCLGNVFWRKKRPGEFCGERWRKLVQSKWGSTNIRIQTCSFRFHWNVMLWCKREFAAHDVDEVFPSSSIQPSPFLQGWWNYRNTGYWKDETIDMYVDFQRLFLYQFSVWVGNDMYFLNGLVTQPQEGWLEVNTKSSRVRAIWMSSATQKQSWTLSIPKGAKQQLMDGGMEQRETSSDWSLNGVSPVFLELKNESPTHPRKKTPVSFQSSPFFFCGCLLPRTLLGWDWKSQSLASSCEPGQRSWPTRTARCELRFLNIYIPTSPRTSRGRKFPPYKKT